MTSPTEFCAFSNHCINFSRGSSNCTGEGFKKAGSMRPLTSAMIAWLRNIPFEPSPFTSTETLHNLVCTLCRQYFVSLSHALNGPEGQALSTTKCKKLTFARAIVRKAGTSRASGARSSDQTEQQQVVKIATPTDGIYINSRFCARQSGPIPRHSFTAIPRIRAPSSKAGHVATTCILCAG